MNNGSLVSLLVALLVFLPVRGQEPRVQKAPSAPPAKQTTPPASKPSPSRNEQDDVLKITTNLVQIDAVVTKDGKQVADLTAEDFEIFEDERLQTITNFSYISTVAAASASPSHAAAPAPAKEKSGPPVLPAAIRPQDTRRTIAVVVDDLGISFESMGPIKRQLRKFVEEQIEPNDLVAIIRTGGEVGALQQFTTDRRLLGRAVEGLRWNPCSRVGITSLAPARILPFDQGRTSTQDLGSGQNGVGMCSSQGNPLSATIRALRFILQGMRELPGRKSMVILSDNFPLDIPDLDSLQQGPIKVDSPVTDAATDEVKAVAGDSQFGNEAALRRTAEIAIRSSVVIYAADTRGIQLTGPTAADNFSSSSLGLRRGTGYLTTQMQGVLGTRSQQLHDGRAGLDLLSRQTGGFLVNGTNDFGLQRMVRDQEGYYLIGYRPGSDTFDKRFHHIKARVKRSGLTVRTREGFYGLNDKDVLPGIPTNRDRIDTALMSPFGTVEIDLRLTAIFANTKDTGSIIRSLLYFKGQDLTFADEPDGSHKATFNLSGILFGDNGSVVHQTTETRTLSLPARDYDRVLSEGLVYLLDLPVKQPGAYQFRVAVRDAASSHIGTAGQLIEVPDLHNQRLALSGITVSNGGAATTPASPAANQTTADDATANPAMRRFRQGSNLLFAYVVYEAQLDKTRHSPNLTAQSRLFYDGKLVYEGTPKPIDVAGQTDLERITAGGGLHLGMLPPGEYILQIVVSDALAPEKFRIAAQWADFEIVQ